MTVALPDAPLPLSTAWCGLGALLTAVFEVRKQYRDSSFPGPMPEYLINFVIVMVAYGMAIGAVIGVLVWEHQLLDGWVHGRWSV